MTRSIWSALSAALLLAAPAAAGHSRFAYVDGGQSVDGRHQVVAELVETPGKGNENYEWRYTWKDTKTGQTIVGKLVGLRSGRSTVFDPVHAHIFVAPGGETFAVWNPNVQARTASSAGKGPDPKSPEYRDFEGFSHRLVVYKKTGEVVRRLDLKDFLTNDDWNWLFVYQKQVYWQSGYPPLTRDNAPRVGYALYKISPDYTVLETMVGATDEAKRVAKDRGVVAPPPRPVRIDLVTGKFLDPKLTSTNPNKEPVRPFVGPHLSGGRGNMRDYVPSLDPVRVAGKQAEAK